MNVPVHCKCGWTGFRRPEKIKSRPCPACDGTVRRFKALERQVAIVQEITSRVLEPTPLERAIDETYAPVPRLPAVYVLPVVHGPDQVFRLPPRRRR